MNPINEDAPPPTGAVGDLVSSLVALGRNVTDANSGAVTGIAITYSTVSPGTWWYSTNNGISWNTVGTVSNENARLLAADANTRIYFQPNPNYKYTGDISFRAWDQTTGSNGGTANTTMNGGSSAFSSTVTNATVVVNPINDAPVIIPNQSFGLSQNLSNGKIIGTVKATDIDDYRTKFSNWQIVDGNIDRDGDGNAAFSINPNTGQITINDVDDLDPQRNPRIN